MAQFTTRLVPLEGGRARTNGSALSTPSTIRRLALLLALLLLATACGGEETPEPEPSDPAPVTEAPAPTAAPSPTAAPTEDGVAAVLGADWDTDSNDNAVPDALEEELDRDPAVDECALAIDCPGVETLGDVEELARQQNTMLLLDASGSMAAADPAGGTKMDQARDALERYVVATPDTTDLGFLVYGHRGSNEPSGKAESCAGVEVLAGLGEVDPATFRATLDSFQPTGYTPIATSLARAGEELAGREGDANRVLLVTDGLETCDGDPVAAARALHESGIEVTVDVVGFDIDRAETPALQALAEAGGGTYTDARTGADVDAYLRGDIDEMFALGGQISCLTGARTQAASCEANLFIEAGGRLNRLSSDARAAGDIAEAEAYSELAQALVERTQERQAAIARGFDEAFAPLLQAFQEAQQRVRDRYGEELSLDCPPPSGHA